MLEELKYTEYPKNQSNLILKVESGWVYYLGDRGWLRATRTLEPFSQIFFFLLFLQQFESKTIAEW